MDRRISGSAVFIRLGARLGEHRHRFCWRIWRAGSGDRPAWPGAIPVDVILIIMGVIAAIAYGVQVAMVDYPVHIATVIPETQSETDHLPRAGGHLHHTLFAGTGHTASRPCR